MRSADILDDFRIYLFDSFPAFLCTILWVYQFGEFNCCDSSNFILSQTLCFDWIHHDFCDAFNGTFGVCN